MQMLLSGKAFAIKDSQGFQKQSVSHLRGIRNTIRLIAGSSKPAVYALRPPQYYSITLDTVCVDHAQQVPVYPVRSGFPFSPTRRSRTCFPGSPVQSIIALALVMCRHLKCMKMTFDFGHRGELQLPFIRLCSERHHLSTASDDILEPMCNILGIGIGYPVV